MANVNTKIFITCYLFFFFGCASSVEIHSNKIKRENSSAQSLSEIDGTWLIDSCVSNDSTITRLIVSRHGFEKRGITLKDSVILFSKNYTFVSFNKSQLRIYTKNTDTDSCSIKGVFGIEKQQSKIKYMYAPLAMNVQRYLLKFNEDFLISNQELNLQNCRGNGCGEVSPWFFASVFYNVNSYYIHGDLLFLENKTRDSKVLTKIILKRVGN